MGRHWQYPPEFPRKEYLREIHYFHAMQARVADGYTTTAFARDVDGLVAFLYCIGRLPEGLKEPSLGRKDHSRGYEPGNIKWQEMQENRTHTDPATLQRISRSLIGNKHTLGYIPSAETRRKASIAMTGRQFSAEHRRRLSLAGFKRKRNGAGIFL